MFSIDFQNVYDLTGIIPKSLTYCNKTYSFGYTWTDLYVRVVMLMCKDHPQILQPGLSFSKLHPHVELGSPADKTDMQKPREIPGTDLFIETKLTANEMLARIKYLIELCNMAYTDVIIQYKTLSSPTAPLPSVPQATLDSARIKAVLQQYFPRGFRMWSSLEMKKFRSYYTTLYTEKLTATDKAILDTMKKVCILRSNVAYLSNAQSESLYQEESRSYLPDMVPRKRHADKADVSNVFSFDDLLQEERYTDLRNTLVSKNITTIEELRHINLWSFMNENNLYTIQQRHTISMELTKVIQRHGVSAGDTATRYVIQYGDAAYTGNTPSAAFVAFLADFATFYPLKFRSLIDIKHPTTFRIVIHRHDLTGNRLKLLNPEVYIDSDLTQEQIELYIAWVCKRCAIDATFSIETLSLTEEVPPQKDDTLPLTEELSSIKDNALPRPQVENTKSVPVENKAPAAPAYVPMTAYFSADMIQRTEKYLLTRNLDGVSYEEMQTQLGWSTSYTKAAVAKSDHIIEMNRCLYHKENFVDFEEGADALASILEKLYKKNGGFTTAAQLWEYAQAEMSMFLNDNDITQQQAIYDLAKHLFEKVKYQGNHYGFNSNMYISLPEVSVDSYTGILQRYAREKGTTVTLPELEEYVGPLGLNIGNLRSAMRIDKEPMFLLYQDKEYLLAELMHINGAFLEQVNTALSHLFADVGDHSILRQIAANWYDLLPPLPATLSWTPLLLQQLLRYYTTKLDARTIQAMDSQNSNTLHAMLVKNDSPIQNFCDAVAIYLHDEMPEKKSLAAEELRKILLNAGMVAGNELQGNMPKALRDDPRFIWDREGFNVTVRI